LSQLLVHIVRHSAFSYVACCSGGLRCTPVTVIVDPKKDIEAELNDKGFKPPVIRIDEGTAIQWKWSGCEVTHTINEATYSHRTGKLHPVDSDERYHHCRI